jgi:cytohesin
MHLVRVPNIILAISLLFACESASAGEPTSPPGAAAGRILALADPGAYPWPRQEKVTLFALHAAALDNDVRKLGWLIDDGAAVDSRDLNGRTPLMVATAFDSREAVAFLLAHGADPRARDKAFGDTPLHLAALSGRVAIARMLMSAGAPPSIASANGATPLHYAALYNQIPMIRFLVDAGADINAGDDPGLTPLQYANRRSRTQASALLRALGARVDTLLDAIRAGDIGRVNELIRTGADPNMADMSGTALYLAAANGHAGIADILIAAGADIEGTGEPAAMHPLHVAAMAGGVRAAALLLDRGADMEARDGWGRTPLMVAAAFASDAVGEMLLARGADVTATDAIYGFNTLHFAAHSGSIPLARRLLAEGVDINGRSALSRATPMHMAAGYGQTEMIAFLAAHGAALAPVDGGRSTPLDRARCFTANTSVALLAGLGAPK